MSNEIVLKTALNCPNCGSIMQASDRYCSSCGQKRMEEEDFSFSHLLTHSVVDYFHIDGGFFKSLWPLIAKPGVLTIEYLAGKRVKYIHPFKMLLFISVMYFLVFPLSIKINSQEKQNPANPNEQVATDSTTNIAKLNITIPGDRVIAVDS